MEKESDESAEELRPISRKRRNISLAALGLVTLIALPVVNRVVSHLSTGLGQEIETCPDDVSSGVPVEDRQYNLEPRAVLSVAEQAPGAFDTSNYYYLTDPIDKLGELICEVVRDDGSIVTVYTRGGNKALEFAEIRVEQGILAPSVSA